MAARGVGDDAGELGLAEEALDRAELALRMARPDRARDTAADAVRLARSHIRTAYGTNQGMDMERRTLLRLAAALPMLPLGALESLEAAASPAPTDDAVLDALTEVSAAYATAYHDVRAATLAPAVDAQLNRLARRLDASLTPARRARLTRLTSETAALAGWLAFDGDRPGAARAHFTLAEQTAVEAADDVLRAAALTSQAALYSPIPRGLRGGDHRAALRLHERAALVTSAPPRLRAWLAARHAEEAALGGDVVTAAVALARAELALESDGDDDAGLVFFAPGAYLATFDLVRLGDYRGFSETLLGDGTTAVTTLSPVLAATAPGTRARMYAASNLARAHVVAGDVDAGAAQMLVALDAAEAMGSAIGVERVRGVRAAAADAAVLAEVDERLSGVAAVSTSDATMPGDE